MKTDFNRTIAAGLTSLLFALPAFAGYAGKGASETEGGVKKATKETTGGVKKGVKEGTGGLNKGVKEGTGGVKKGVKETGKFFKKIF